jgi:AcrR family transcriptional regulator
MAVPGDGVKGRRAYDASGRRAAAAARRRTVVAAAQALLEERGYAATTVVDVARRAGVSPEGVYKGFGTKAALTKAVFDVAVAGDDEDVPVAEQPAAVAIRAEPDVREKLRLYAADAAERHRRSARIQLVVRDGAAADPALAEVWVQVQAERLTGMTMLARHLVDSGGLAVGVEEARDVLWTCISVEVWDLLVHQRAWSPEAYAAWLARTLVASLVGPG